MKVWDAFVRGTLELTLLVVETVPAALTRLTLRTRGVGTTSEVEVALTYSAQEPGTRVILEE